jgi:hypothetical protein
VIGVKSWSDAAESFWLAQTAWHCSLFFSILALISSSQERMLERIPRDGDSNPSIADALLMVLVPSKDGDVEKNKEVSLKISPWLLLLWQTPLMLMHYSWVMFLVGYELYLITPLLARGEWTGRCTVSVKQARIRAY